jgi:hypothetical protein
MSYVIPFLHHFALAYLLHGTTFLLVLLSARPHIRRAGIRSSSGASSSRRVHYLSFGSKQAPVHLTNDLVFYFKALLYVLH